VKLNRGFAWQKKLSRKNLLTSKLDFAESWSPCKVEQKYLKSIEMRCWMGMEEISWMDRVRKVQVLHRVKEEWLILYTVNGTNANWIGHILSRNFLLKHFAEGKTQGRV
jgi:hypothetical protein